LHNSDFLPVASEYVEFSTVVVVSGSLPKALSEKQAREKGALGCVNGRGARERGAGLCELQVRERKGRKSV